MGKSSGVLYVLMNGLHVGSWTTERSTHRFNYSQDWLDSAYRRPLSLSMPLRDVADPYSGHRVESFFDNLLPDSVDIRRRIRGRVGAESTDAFDLLSEIGNDCIGAVQLVRDLDNAGDVKSIQGHRLDEHELVAELRGAVSRSVPGTDDDNFLRLSLAGAQEKTGLLWHENAWHKPALATPTTHILKLPMGRVGMEQADLSTSVENEWLCGKLLKGFGLQVAHSDILQLEDGLKVLAVRRFDRKLSGDKKWWMRIPQEDMCQAMAVAPDKKYESDGGPGIESIMTLLLGSKQHREDRELFLKTQVLFWLLCAPDGHAKNFSIFIESEGRYRMTPIYDVISAFPFLGKTKNKVAPQRINLAMAWVGSNRHYKWSVIQRRHIDKTAQKVGMHSSLTKILNDIKSNADNAIAEVEAQLPTEFPPEISDAIFDGLRAKISHLDT